MSKKRRLLLGLGAAAGGLAAAAVVPMVIAHADDCKLGECVLLQAGSPTDESYEGFRPLFSWWGENMPVNVDVTQAGVSTVSGSYSVAEQDYNTAFFDDSSYTFGNFVPSATNTTGTDSLGLSGAHIYDFLVGSNATADGVSVPANELTYAFDQLDIDGWNGSDYAISIVPGAFTNILESNATGSADWLEMAGQAPQLIWDSLPSTSLPDMSELMSLLPPDPWFP